MIPSITRSQSGNLNKPKIEYVKKGDNPNPLSIAISSRATTNKTSAQTDNQANKVEKTPFDIKKKESKKLELAFREYSPDVLKEIGKKMGNIKLSAIHKRSKGFIMLLSFHNEVKNPEAHKTQGGKYSRKKYSRTPNEAQLVELNPDRFTSTKHEKNAGLWDETSNEAFKMAVNHTLNGITEAKIDQALNTIQERLRLHVDDQEEQMDTEEEKKMTLQDKYNYVASVIVQKASSELAFAAIYSQLTAKCPPFLRDPIVQKTISDFYEYCYNPCNPALEEESLFARGSAKFFGALTSTGVIAKDNFLPAFELLISKLHGSEEIHPQYVEMSKELVLASGANFCKSIADEAKVLWEYFDEVKDRKGLKPRLRFLLKDVVDQRDEWVLGITAQRVAIEDEKLGSNENQTKVRFAYSSYMDGDSPRIDLKSRDFLRACLDLLPDQKDNYSFCQFIVFMLTPMKPKVVTDVCNVICDKVSWFRSSNIEKDSPKIWNNVSDMIMTLILGHLLTRECARQIRREFPDKGSTFDPDNAMKWYLNDYHMFYEPIKLEKGQWPNEIINALQMPNTIKNPPQTMQLSRLTVVALIRSIGSVIANESNDKVHVLQKWKSLLRIAHDKFESVFNDEITILIDTLKLSFQTHDVIAFLSDKK